MSDLPTNAAPDLPYARIQEALAAQPLFEAKTWQLSPEAWPLSPEQVAQLEAIGVACLEYHQALENLYLRSAAGKNLLRNKPLLAPWVVDYLDRGKPESLISQARDPRNRGAFPPVLRPDLLLTAHGFVMTELDSVPGGIGLTAFLNRLYSGGIVGEGDLMIKNFYAALAALRPAVRNPLIALVVSDEAATYRPEMSWLAHQLQLEGKRVFCLRPGDLFPLGGALFFDADGNPEKIDVLYRFFELFDLPPVPGGEARFRPVPPPPAPGLLGGGARGKDAEAAPLAHSPFLGHRPCAASPRGGARRAAHWRPGDVGLARTGRCVPEGEGTHHQDQRVP